MTPVLHPTVTVQCMSRRTSTDKKPYLKLQLSVRAAVLNAADQPFTGYSNVNSTANIIRAPARSTGRLQDVAAEVAGLSPSQAQELIQLGAVYYGDPEVPLDEKPRWRKAWGLTDQALDHPIQQVSACMHHGQSEQFLANHSRTLKAAYHNSPEQGQWLRVHPNPKRYPAARATDWPSRVLHLDDDVCVVDKPAGIPVQCHESNACETVPRCMEAALGIPRLWVRTKEQTHLCFYPYGHWKFKEVIGFNLSICPLRQCTAWQQQPKM